jgi:hypothetical protein
MPKAEGGSDVDLGYEAQPSTSAFRLMPSAYSSLFRVAVNRLLHP